MRSLKYCLLLVVLLFYLECFPQLKLIPGESFLSGIQIKKIFVSVEDHAVWALTMSGKVYLKKTSDADFNLYAPTLSIIVEEITGYKEDEMYFLIKPDVIVHFRSGLKIEIRIPYPEVKRINNISIIKDNKQTPYYLHFSSYPNKDYLAIATNKHMYKVFRGDILVTETQPYTNAPIVNDPEWRITNTSNFSVDFQYEYPLFACYFQPKRTTLSFFSNLYYMVSSAIPDNDQYPSKINATLMAHYYLDAKNTEYTSKLNFWGTDDGLFVKGLKDCPIPIINKVINNEVINDLEEIHALSPVAMQNYVLAATNKGIYFTPKSIFSNSNISSIQFVPLTNFPENKVNSLCMDVKEYESIDLIAGLTYDTMCEKVIWVGSNSGIRKVYALLEQDYFNDYLLSNMGYSKQPDNVNDYTKAIFKMCGNENLTIDSRIAEDFNSQLLIQWYKDGIELSQFVGKTKATFTESGTYYFTALVLCEGIKLTSIPIIINKDKGPEITFAYPATINICSGKNYVFQTKQVTGYIYKWFKDNIQISGAAQSSYTANATGDYRVEVSSCSNSFESSVTTKLSVLQSVIPILTKDKTSYCVGEEALLKVDNVGQLQTRWYYNDEEIIDLRGKNEVQVNKSGNYNVSFLNAGNCEVNSTSIPINFLAKPIANLTRSSDKVLCIGETVRLTANSNMNSTYLWNTGETTASIEVKKAGKYSVAVLVNGGCSITSEEVEVVYSQLPDATIKRNTSKTLCEGETVTLSVPFVAENKYLWSNGETSNVIMVDKSGNYKVKVYSPNGCYSESLEERVSLNLLTLPIPKIQSICIKKNQQIELKAPQGYRYYTWNGIKTTNPFLMVSKAGSYTLEIEDENFCKAATTYVVVPNCDEIIVTSAFSPNGDGVNDIWNIYGLENDPKATITIFNRWGSKIYETTGNKAFWNGYTKHGPATTGVYYYIIISNNIEKTISGSVTLIK